MVIRLIEHENAVLVDMRNDKDYRDRHAVNAVQAPADNNVAAGKLDRYLTTCSSHAATENSVNE